MVLVDTSVWIRFLANRTPYARELDTLLADRDVLGHDLVFGELLVGDRGGRSALLAEYVHMQQARSVSHAEVVDFVRDRKLHGLGLGWIDTHLLASAFVGRFQIWTADIRFREVASELGVSYRG
jgi:predicted nucleic acid-binding protein